MLYSNKFKKNLYFDKIHIPCFAILLREITDLTFFISQRFTVITFICNNISGKPPIKSIITLLLCTVPHVTKQRLKNPRSLGISHHG